MNFVAKVLGDASTAYKMADKSLPGPYHFDVPTGAARISFSRGNNTKQQTFATVVRGSSLDVLL